MNKKEGLLLSLVLLIAVFGIMSMNYVIADNNSTTNNENSDSIHKNGTINFVDVEGGCWKIVTTDGISYEPTNLNNNYRQNGLIVEFKGIIKEDMASTCQVGTLIELTSIKGIASRTNDENDSISANDDNESEEDNPNLISAQEENETKERNKEAVQEKNRINFENKTGQECPDNCTCTGVVIKCKLQNGTREMTVYSQSGNIIFQVKEINATTNVTLYQHDGKVYGVNEDNETKIINYLPDQIQEKIRERTRARLNNTNISLNENGEYEYEAEKEARFFGIFKVHEKVSWNIDAETGNISNENAPWWGFLASDVKE